MIKNTHGLPIKSITLVTQVGVKTYQLGDKLSGGRVVKIELANLSFTGDPASQYLGYDESGKILFSVDPMCPHECEYL